MNLEEAFSQEYEPRLPQHYGGRKLTVDGQQLILKPLVAKNKEEWNQNGYEVRNNVDPYVTIDDVDFYRIDQVIRKKKIKRESRKLNKLNKKIADKKEEEEKAKNKVIQIFNQRWESLNALKSETFIHVGPTNSGKTYEAIKSLKESKGLCAYLAPLRLLAWEIADKLNENGVDCSLITGEEVQIKDGAKIISSTVEMFDDNQIYDTVIVDECQMLADKQRGWAWTRAIVNSKAKNLHLIVAPHAKNLVVKLLNKLETNFEIREYQRFSELKISEDNYDINNPPHQSIIVTFSRISALSLKHHLEERGYLASVIYGALPPDVRRKQISRFLSQEVNIIASTDAIGMGINCPAKHVIFTELTKFDGEKDRFLLPEEVLQIAGRAGRYTEAGFFGTTNSKLKKQLKSILDKDIKIIEKCYISPEVEELAVLEGKLIDKLRKWKKINAIPDSLRDIFRLSDLSQQEILATMLSQKEENKLGLEKSYLLCKAPASKMTYDYWIKFARHIGKNKPLPMPFNEELPTTILNKKQLEEVEALVERCEIYAWLGNRKEFQDLATEKEIVAKTKDELSELIDHALLKQKIDASRRCSSCKNKLPLFWEYGKCKKCWDEMQMSRMFYDDDF